MFDTNSPTNAWAYIYLRQCVCESVSMCVCALITPINQTRMREICPLESLYAEIFISCPLTNTHTHAHIHMYAFMAYLLAKRTCVEINCYLSVVGLRSQSSKVRTNENTNESFVAAEYSLRHELNEDSSIILAGTYYVCAYVLV